MGIGYRNPGGGYGWMTPDSGPGRGADTSQGKGCVLFILVAVVAAGGLAWALGGVYVGAAVVVIPLGFLVFIYTRLGRDEALRARATWSRVHAIGTRGYGPSPYNFSAYVIPQEDGTYWIVVWDDVSNLKKKGPRKGLPTLEEAKSAADALAHENEPYSSCHYPVSDCEDWKQTALGSVVEAHKEISI